MIERPMNFKNLVLLFIGCSLLYAEGLRAQIDSMPPPALPQYAPYHLITKTVIGGEGGWDYVAADAQNRRLYIAHSTQVDVYDMNGDSLVGHILHTEGVHGIAIVNREHHGFITCGRSNTVFMFDLRTLD